MDDTCILGNHWPASMALENVSDTSATRRSRTRRWLFRVFFLLLPLFFLLLSELVLWQFGWFPDPVPGLTTERDQIRQGEIYFPGWRNKLVMPKPAGRLRIFTLGGSSTYGFGVSQNFSQMLAAQLRRRYPNRSVEVVNGGVVAVGSKRIGEILKLACTFDPDLIVLYFGHNEFLERVFYDPQGLVSAWRTGQRWSRKLRTVNALRSLVPQTWLRAQRQHHVISGRGGPLIKNEKQRHQHIDALQENLAAMIGHCQAHQIPLLVLPAVANLLAEPGSSRVMNYQPEFDVLLKSARQAIKQRQWDQAKDQIRQLRQLDANNSAVHYLVGLLSLVDQKPGEARQQLEQALDLDRRGDRCAGWIAEAILNTCQTHETPCIDLRDQFWADLDGDFSRTLESKMPRHFNDHCHPSRSGHQLVANAITAYVVKQRLPKSSQKKTSGK